MAEKNKLPTISFAVTVSTEHDELKVLLDQLCFIAKTEDEIVIQTDTSTVTKKVTSVIKEFQKKDPKIKCITFPLNGDFSAFKNNLKDNCTKEYVFQIDADEELGVFLWEIHEIIAGNPTIDLFHLCRVNTVEGITPDYVYENNWKVDYKNFYNGQPIINWPDPQARLFKNKKSIKWKNKVHEQIVGHKKFTLISNGTYGDIEGNRRFSLIHCKTFEKQVRQNDFYKTLTP